MKRLLILYLFILFLSVSASASLDSVRSLFHKQLELFPQEKLYLHLDKSRYMGGEKIWFRAYMVDAVSHAPMLLSNCVYVELIGPENDLVARVKLIPTDGVFSGYMEIPGQTRSGSYKIRAYTHYMRNVGEDYFFMRRIPIEALTAEEEKKEKMTSGDYDVSFFPEGGRLPAGVLCHVGVKSLNNKGFSEEITGLVLDEAGDTITAFETIYAGMGQFGFVPEVGKRYYAICQNQTGIAKKVFLPEPETGVCNVQAHWARNNLIVSLTKSYDMLDVPDDYSVLIHCRGIILHAQKWEKEKSYLSFPRDIFPSGVLQILLLDSQNRPVSERLLFCRNEDQACATIELNKEAYMIRDYIKGNVVVTDPKGKPLAGSLSVSVVDEGDLLPDTTVSILSSLLLSADLKGYIEEPEFYFQEDSPLAERALDCLMLTQGWRRYHVEKLLKGEFERPTELLELGRFITGKVTYAGSKKALKDIQVNVLSPDRNFLHTTRTDKDGRFKLEGFEHPDSTAYVVTALSPAGNDLLELHVDTIGFSPICIPWTSKPMNWADLPSFREKAYLRRFYDPNIRVINLEEVIIKGKKMERKKPLPLHQEMADKTLSNETIERFKPSTIKSLLELIPGVSVSGSTVYLNRLGREYSAKILVDGFEGDEVSVHDVDRVDVIYPPAANIYGMDTAGGVVAISTKVGGNDESGKIRLNSYRFTPLGYQTFVEFYAPAYKTATQKNGTTPDLRTTIYWNPNLTLSEKGKAVFDFYSADTATAYYIVVEGVTSSGRLVYCKKRISINKEDNVY